MNNQGEEKFKEYSHLNNHYLKISLTSQCLTIIGLNIENLNNIIYKFSVTSEEINQNNKYNNISLNELYEKIIELIEKNKFFINGDHNCIALSVYEGDTFDINKDFQFFLIKTNEDEKASYSNAIKKIIMSLKNENVKYKTQIEELQLNNKAQSAEFVSYPGQKAKTSIVSKDSDPFKKIPSTDQIDKKSNSDNPLKKFDKKKSKFGLSISQLAKLNYNSYPMVELNTKSLNIISAYGGNTYNGISRSYNEDTIKIITEYKLKKPAQKKSGEIVDPTINYFAIYDGHGGDKCSIFLRDKLHDFIFESEFFPIYTLQAINAAYVKAEEVFYQKAVDPNTGKLVDRSGSCAISALIMDEWCFIINLGDSRALFSYDTGKKLVQVSRDHKPNDPIEKERIEKNGGSICKMDYFMMGGNKVKIDEKNLSPGVKIPYRMIPGYIAVSNNIIYIFYLIKMIYRLQEVLEIIQ